MIRLVYFKDKMDFNSVTPVAAVEAERIIIVGMERGYFPLRAEYVDDESGYIVDMRIIVEARVSMERRTVFVKLEPTRTIPIDWRYSEDPDFKRHTEALPVMGAGTNTMKVLNETNTKEEDQ